MNNWQTKTEPTHTYYGPKGVTITQVVFLYTFLCSSKQLSTRASPKQCDGKKKNDLHFSHHLNCYWGNEFLLSKAKEKPIKVLSLFSTNQLIFYFSSCLFCLCRSSSFFLVVTWSGFGSHQTIVQRSHCHWHNCSREQAYYPFMVNFGILFIPSS